MKTAHSFSLAAVFTALALTFLSSCGTVGDGNGNNGAAEVTPSSSSGEEPYNPPPPPSSSSQGSTTQLICTAHWNSFELSAMGKSYADVDYKITLTRTDIINNDEDIDLIAYHTGNAGDFVYSPFYLTESSYARIFGTEAALLVGVDDDNYPGSEKIAISNDAVFYLESSEFEMYRISVIGMGNSSVTLKAERCVKN